MTFPTAPEGLTPDFLSDALGRPVSDFRVERFGAGSGIMGMVTRVHLTGPSGPATIIAKFPSPAAANRAVARTYDMYGREVRFYRSVAPKISLRVPACYYAALDPGGTDFLLLMEDLGALRVGDQVVGCGLDDAHRIVEAIAGLHATTWGWRPGADVVCHDNPAQRDGMMAGFRMGWPVVRAQFADLLPANADRLGEAVPAAVPRLLKLMCSEPTCVAHADLRLDNVLFDDDAIALVDWQSVCISAPEQDLAYFVTQSLPESVRHAEDWVAVYHRALTGHGIDYDLDACRERYRVCALYLLCFAVVIAGTLDLSNERGQALGRTLLGNAMRSLEELNAFSLLD